MADNLSKSRLDSWKQIADYLVRDVRTVIRWEKDKCLPVHRVPGGKRHAVFAYREEIDAWLASGSAAANHAEAETPRRASWGWTVAVAAVLLIAGAVVSVRSFLRAQPAQIERITFRGSEIVAWDSRGEEAWAYRFEPALLDDIPPQQPGHPPRMTRILDLDGDGRNEVLVVVRQQTGPNSTDPARTQLICLSSRGEILWRYEADEVFTFGGQEYKGPWAIYDVLVVPASPQPLIWVAGVHHISFPCFVAQIDPASGKGQVRFANSGVLNTLGYTKNEEGSYLLVGGFNSEYDAGNLAVLDLGQPFAASPQTPGSRYHCQSCPEGFPSRYFVFPRSELNRLNKVSLNNVFEVVVREEGIKASTAELSMVDRAVYEFPPNLDPAQLRVFFTTDYWKQHEALEKEGKIGHPAEKCPDRVPSRVRVWSPDDGWAEVARLSR